VALTTANTVSPFLSFNSSALRRVMALSNEIVTHPDDHMGHDITQLDFFDSSPQLVSG
jgi:hypothetical protein